MRLKIGEDGYAASFPQERPIPGMEVKIWNEEGEYLGVGHAFETRKCGVALIVNGLTIDSNHVAHWCSA